MKLFHTSDWHLGRMLYGRSLLEDQRWFLRQVFLPAVEHAAGALPLHGGEEYLPQKPALVFQKAAAVEHAAQVPV